MTEALGRIRARLVAHGPRLLAFAQRTFLAVALIAIGYYLVRHAGELRALLSWRVASHCLAAAVLMAALHPLIALAFFQLQRYAGVAIDLSTSLAIYMRRIPARYVPGGIWHAVSRFADMRFDAGVGGAQLRRLFVYEMALVASCGLLACGIGLVALPAHSRALLLAAVQAAAGAVVIVVALMLTRRRAGGLRLVAAVALFLVIWPLTAFAFATVAAAVSGGDCGVATAASTYLIAAVQGYLAVFAPQGWGVAEASFALLNPCGVALSEVLGAFLLFRISSMAGDLLGYAVWALLMRRAGAARLPSAKVD